MAGMQLIAADAAERPESVEGSRGWKRFCRGRSGDGDAAVLPVPFWRAWERPYRMAWERPIRRMVSQRCRRFGERGGKAEVQLIAVGSGYVAVGDTVVGSFWEREKR
jgi:hypothetical protein